MKLSDASVSWARKHLVRYYDSDFFYKPFEYQCLWTKWDDILSYFNMTDLESHRIVPPLVYAAPKTGLGYRMVHQLDPLDTIIYTALTYEIGNTFENLRLDKDEKIACSYRISMNNEGSLFLDHNGYKDFYERSVELSHQHKYVLTTDITDFYNQVYLRRLQSITENLLPDSPKTTANLFDFLFNINGRISKGIPVGPTSSIVISEIVLHDIDQFIVKLTDKYTRYADDIRIFSDSTEELNQILVKITSFLYMKHRLTLSNSKTELFSSEVFLNDTLLFKNEEYNFNSIHSINDPIDLGEVWDKLINSNKLDLGIARYLLRFSKKEKSSTIAKGVLENFNFFLPVLRDVVLYFESITDESFVIEHLHLFEEILIKNKFHLNPFVNHWLGNYFSKHNDFFESKIIRVYLEKNQSIRIKALYAKSSYNHRWVQEHINNIEYYSNWDRRGIIYAASILPRQYRNRLKDKIWATGDIVDFAVCSFVGRQH